MVRSAKIKPQYQREPQTSPDVLSVGLLIARARAALLTSLDAELEPFGLTGAQYSVLKHLAEGTAETAADLRRTTGTQDRDVPGRSGVRRARRMRRARELEGREGARCRRSRGEPQSRERPSRCGGVAGRHLVAPLRGSATRWAHRRGAGGQ